MMTLAKWQETLENDKIRCTLCPRYCRLSDGQTGFCAVRQNINGKLYALAYGRPTGFAIDPIEKKPLNHFLPATNILSFGTAGCNLGCKFCQNWTMSKAQLDDAQAMHVQPDQVVKLAKQRHTPSIAFTYNDPIIFGEYVIDIARLAREEGIHSVMVTNGYIDPVARREVFKDIAAANVDLKGFSETFYRKLTLARLQPVLDTLIWIKNETNVWLEITTLLIPGANDATDEIKAMCEWILDNLGESVPVHFTAFHPTFRLTDRPRTAEHILRNARQLALEAGIKHCYLGNISDTAAQSTYCPQCGELLIQRDWHRTAILNLKNGRCAACNQPIAGIWQ